MPVVDTDALEAGGVEPDLEAAGAGGLEQGSTATVGPSRWERRARARSQSAEGLDEGFLDRLFDQVDAGEIRLTADGTFLPEMIKAVRERGLAVELAEHLG